MPQLRPPFKPQFKPNKPQHRLRTVSMAALAAVLLACIGCSAVHTVQAAESPSIAGTWQLQITLKDCSSGATIGQPFVSLLTFAQGGTLTETTANPSFFPAVRGPGHGNWSSTGTRTYTASTVAYITANGALAKIQTITQPAINMDTDNTFQTPTATVRFFAPDGTPQNSACATATGKRYGTDGSL